jgi:hypothetical protein
MMRKKRPNLLWPEPAADNATECATEMLFDEDARERRVIRDRHGCTRWIGPVVLFLRLPQVGTTSLDLLRRADREAYVSVVKQTLRVMKDRVSSRSPETQPRTPEDLARRDSFAAAYAQHGQEVRDVSAALQRFVGGSLWCAGFALPELRGTSESQILRSLGLTVQEARDLIAARRGSAAPI